MTTTYKAWIISLRNAVAFTTSLWWILVFLFVLLLWNGMPAYLSIILIIFIFAYSWYLWKVSVDDIDGQAEQFDLTTMDVSSVSNIERVQRALQELQTKWRAIGSPAGLVKQIDLIQFLYALLPWQYYDEDAFNTLVENCNTMYLPTNAGNFIRSRQKLLTEFDNAFATYPNYDAALARLTTITSQSSSTSSST